MKNVLIIGGGASGMIAAIIASKNGNKVTILEKNNICGKKLLLTGASHCNYWNDDFTINHFRSSNKDLLNEVINEENKKNILNFFDSIGVIPKIKNGYYYPYSNVSNSILNSLLLEMNKNNVNIIYNANVKNLKYFNNKFIVNYNNDFLETDKVIIATGSFAAPKTGSDGYGFELLQKFNHTINNITPALVQLVADGNYFKLWSGIRAEANIKLEEKNKIIAEYNGELQLTDYGLSGICAMQLSGRISKGLFNKLDEYVLIDFMPSFNKDLNEFVSYCNLRANKIPNRNLVEFFESIINYKLLMVLFKVNNININTPWQKLNKEEKIKVINTLRKFKLKIIDTKSFNEAQTCTGGIPLEEINISSFESLKQKGLFITGELIDVDGDCGGYNLGFAWISGFLAGLGASKND